MSTLLHDDDCGCDECRVEYDDETLNCARCNNEGEILICPDDICHGAGECMHGDGMIVCPDCKGESAC